MSWVWLTAVVATAACGSSGLNYRPAVGSCITLASPGTSKMVGKQVVSCQEPHTGEVFGTITAPAGASYDANTDDLELYRSECHDELRSYAPDFTEKIGPGDYVMRVNLHFATDGREPEKDVHSQNWDQGGRSILCIMTSPDGTTGSIRDD